MSYQLESHIVEKLKLFFTQFDFIDKVVIFGSRAKHDANPKSDIDLCIYSLEMTAKEFIKLKIELDELPILYKIDIVHFEKSNDELKKNIEKDGKYFFIKELPFNLFFKNISAKPFQIEKKDYKETGKYPVVDQGKKFIVGYSDNEEKFFKLENPIIIFGDHTRIIKYVDFDFIIGADGTKILLPYHENIDVKYAYYKLLHTKIENLGYSRHYKLLKEKIFQKPSLTKQKEIAKTLDKAQELIELRKESIKKLDALSKSIFIDMFGDPVSNPKKWDFDKMGNYMKIRRGASPRPIAKFIGNDIPWIKIGDATNGNDLYIETTKVKIILEGKDKSVYLKKGSLVFANCGVSLGFSRILKIDGCIHDGWLSFEDISTKLDEIFVLKFINNSTQRLRDSASGGTQPNLNIDIMKNFKIFIPPLSIQKQFVSAIQKIEQQKALYEEQLTTLQENFDALLAQSFKA